jgi:ClpP class serine protease
MWRRLFSTAHLSMAGAGTIAFGSKWNRPSDIVSAESTAGGMGEADADNAAEKAKGSPKVVDSEKQLLQKHRVVFFTGRINDDTARAVTAKLMYLNAVSPQKPITLVLNSGGGNISAGFLIYDTIKQVRSIQSVAVVVVSCLSLSRYFVSTPNRQLGCFSSVFNAV